MQKLSYPTETVLSNKIGRNRKVLSFKDSPRIPFGRRPKICIYCSTGATWLRLWHDIAGYQWHNGGGTDNSDIWGVDKNSSTDSKHGTLWMFTDQEIHFYSNWSSQKTGWLHWLIMLPKCPLSALCNLRSAIRRQSYFHLSYISVSQWADRRCRSPLTESVRSTSSRT